MNLGLMPAYLLREWTSDGKPLSGGTLSFYQSGTFTPKAVYADSAGTISLGSVVTLDASGSAVVFLGRGAYRIWLKQSNGVQVAPYVDGIVGSGFGVDVQSNISLAMVKNYDDLRQLTGEIDVVYVSGRLEEGDGGAGIFQYVPSDISTDNDGTILVTSLAQKVYKRVFDGYIDPQWFGVAYGNNDSYYTLLQALNVSAAINFPVLISGAVYISQNLVVPDGANVEFTDGAFIHTGASALTVTFSAGSHLKATSRIFGTNIFPKIGKGVCDKLPISWMAGQVDDDRLDKLLLATTDPTQIVEIDESISVLATTWVCVNQLRFTFGSIITFTGTSDLNWTSEYILPIPFKTFAIAETDTYVFNFGNNPAYLEMFGAVADGVTDDSNWLKIASTNKKIILVSGKTYFINSSVSASEISIEGSGTLLLGTTTTLTIDTFSIDAVTITLATRNNLGSTATIESSDTSGNATLVSPGLPFKVMKGTKCTIPDVTGGNWTATEDSDNLHFITGLGWGTVDYFAGKVMTITLAPDSTEVYLVANVFYANDSAFPSYYSATTELFQGCTFTDLGRVMVHTPPNLYNASLPLIPNASSLGTDPTGLIIGVGGTETFVQGVDYTVEIGNNTWGTTLTGSSLQIIDIAPQMSILTWTMDMHGGIPPQSPTNLFAYVNFTAISDKLKARLGLSTLKYGSNKLVNGIVNRLGATVYQSGRTIPYPVTFPHVMNMAFQSGYVLDFVFLGPKGTEGSDSQNGYTPNPWMGWGDIYSAGTGYIATPDYHIGGSGLLINQHPFE